MYGFEVENYRNEKSPKTRAKDTKKGLDSAYLLW